MTRATVALLHGHVVDAVRLNALSVLYLGFLIWSVLTVVVFGGTRTPGPKQRTGHGGVRSVGLVALVLCFTVVRNLA
jgi:hypothetical protein